MEKKNGNGLFQTVKNTLIRTDSYNNVSRRTLEIYGNLRITNILIRRFPINGLIQGAIESIVGKQNVPFSKLFHLQLLVTLENSRQIVIEKVATINISDRFIINPPNMEQQIVNVTRRVTPNTLCQNARNMMGDALYFAYNAFQNNCQVYVYNLLFSSGLLTQQNKDFIYQDLKTIVQKMPAYASMIANVGTTLGAVANKVVGGDDDGFKHFVKYVSKKRAQHHTQEELLRKFFLTKKGKEIVHNH